MALASVMQEEHLGSTWFSFGAEVHVPLLTFLWSMRYGAIFFRIHIWSNSLRRPRLKFVFLIFYFDSPKKQPFYIF